MTALAQAIRTTLTPIGFERKGSRFYRGIKGSRRVQVVVCLPSKSGLSMDVWLGVFDREVTDLLWKEQPKAITEMDCVVVADLSLLLGLTNAWREDSPEDAKEATSGLERVGIPWLESMREPRDWVSYLREKPGRFPLEETHLAIAEALSGDRHQAQRRLSELLAAADGAWAERLERVRVGLELSD